MHSFCLNCLLNTKHALYYESFWMWPYFCLHAASIWPPFLINDLIEQSNVNYWIYNTCILSQQFVWYPVRLFFELIQIYPHFGLHFDSIWPPFLRIDVIQQSNATYISDNNSLMPQRFFWYPSRLCFELVETRNHFGLHLASFWPLNLGMI